MLIKDFITPPENTPDNFYTGRLKNQVSESCSIFLNNCKSIKVSTNSTASIIKEGIRFRKKLTKFNEEYRQNVLGQNPKAKTPAITIGKYIVSMQTLIQTQFNFYVDSTKKLDYSKSKLTKVVIDELSLLYAKFKKIYDFQFFTIVCQVITDYFIIEEVDFNEIEFIMTDILEMDFSVIETIINEHNIRETTNKAEKSKIDNAFPDKETVEGWLAAGYKRTYIKRSLAQQLGVSEKTVQRLLASYNLTDLKYTTKTNLNK